MHWQVLHCTLCIGMSGTGTCPRANKASFGSGSLPPRLRHYMSQMVICRQWRQDRWGARSGVLTKVPLAQKLRLLFTKRAMQKGRAPLITFEYVIALQILQIVHGENDCNGWTHPSWKMSTILNLCIEPMNSNKQYIS